jgi:hypothetical protein
VRYELRDYDVDPDALNAETVAGQIGLPPEQSSKRLWHAATATASAWQWSPPTASSTRRRFTAFLHLNHSQELARRRSNEYGGDCAMLGALVTWIVEFGSEVPNGMVLACPMGETSHSHPISLTYRLAFLTTYPKIASPARI